MLKFFFLYLIFFVNVNIFSLTNEASIPVKLVGNSLVPQNKIINNKQFNNKNKINFEKYKSCKVSINSKIDGNTTIYKNDILKVIVTLSWQGPVSYIDFDAPTKPDSIYFNLVSSSTSNQTEVKDGVIYSKREYIYTLRPIKSGLAVINPITVRYRDLSGQLMSLKTTSFDIKILDKYRKNGSNLKNIADIIAIVVIVLVIIIFITNRKKVVVVEKNDKKEEIPLEQKYILRFEKLNKYITDGEYKEYFNEITVLLRDFIVEKYGITKTKNDIKLIKKELEAKSISQDIINNLSLIYEKCDMVKFAMYMPEKDDIKEIETRVKEFINK